MIKSTLLALTAAVLMSGCSAFSSDEGASAQNTQSQTAQTQSHSYQLNDYQNLISPYSLIPRGTDLQYLKLTHLMQGSEVVCVLNSGDFSDGQYVVRNSGSYVQRSIGDNFEQHGNKVVLMQGSDPTYLQEQARSQGCSLIAATRLLNWTNTADNKPFISIRMDMYDVSSLSLLNSVRFMAGANSLADLYDESKGVIKPLIATYIHKLYQN